MHGKKGRKQKEESEDRRLGGNRSRRADDRVPVCVQTADTEIVSASASSVQPEVCTHTIYTH